MQSIIISGGNSDLRNSKFKDLSKKTEFENDPDLIWISAIDGKKQISIAQIRESLKEQNFKPLKSEVKYILIVDSEKLGIEAQNSLLKSLEEPPEYICFVLLVNHYDNLIDTIRSRCILYDLGSSQKVECANEIINISDFMSSDIGKRIDMINKAKDKINDRIIATEMLENWAWNLHKSILDSNPSVNANAIKEIASIKDKILINNANVILSIEYLALYI